MKVKVLSLPSMAVRRWLGMAGLCVAIAAATDGSYAGPARPDDAALWRPRFATPALVALDSTANRQFLAEVKASKSAKNWSALLANDLRAWPCKIISAKYATINRGTEPGWQVKLSVPADISPELFTLSVSNNETVSLQKQAVSVTPAFNQDFYILHISDEQIVNQLHTDPSGQFHHTVGTWEEIKWMQEPVNLIHPRLVIVTGDQIDFNGALDGWNNWSNWDYKPGGKRVFTAEETAALEARLGQLYKDCHAGYRVPYVQTPGNHDVTPPGKLLHGSTIDWHPISARAYEAAFGQRSWSFRMGDFYVLMHDWSDAGLKEWAARDYSVASKDPSVHFRLVGQHYHAKWDGAPTGNAAFQPSSCDLMLIGHGHTVATMQSSPYFIYEDGPTFKYGTSGFFNFRRAPNGWRCDQTACPRNTTNDTWHLFTDNGGTQLVRADQPDSMRITATSVTIANDLPQAFYDGRVRFILEKGKYANVNNGTILAQYDCEQGTKTAVLVKVSIPAKGSVTVTVPGLRPAS